MPERALPPQPTAGRTPACTSSLCLPSDPSGDRRRPLLGIETHPAGDWTVVVVSGELDIVTEQELHEGLRKALTTSARGIDLDLGGVDFFDCSGLNVLLRIRRHALEHGKSITVQATTTAVRRLLTVTGTLPLFAVPGEDHRTRHPPDAPAGITPGPDAQTMPLGDAELDLRIELVQLRRAMETRPVIDLARGVLMASFGLSADDAWKVLVSVSQNTNTKLHHVADDLVGAVTGDALPELLQQHISESVTKLQTPPAAPCGTEG